MLKSIHFSRLIQHVNYTQVPNFDRFNITHLFAHS